MNLFNAKTLAHNINASSPIPEDHMRILQQWSELIVSGRIYDHKEIALHSEFKSLIVEKVLGYKGPVGEEAYTVSSEQSILSGSVDLALGHFQKDNHKIIAPFELKGAKTRDLDAIMPGRAKSPVQQAWEYATNAPGVKWVFVSNYVEIRFYGFGEGTQIYEKFDLAKLIEPEEYARFMLLLSVDNLLGGRTQELLAESHREDKDITDALYSDYNSLRSVLIFSIRQQLPDLPAEEAISTAQLILDRVLFIAFAEDTGLLPERILEKAFDHSDPFNPKPVWENFKGLFKAINNGNKELNIAAYNGGLFAEDHLANAVQLDDALCETFKNIGAYDFASEISITVLGHIFEQSISDIERLQAQARGEDVAPETTRGATGRRKRDGVVYTPDYIARFIVDQTIGTHLDEIFKETFLAFAKKGADISDYENIPWKRKGAELEAWEAYRERLKNLRIVDPACGSGVFLVMAFDFMKAELSRVNDKIAALSKGQMGDLFDPDSEILTRNLFGVDVNTESVEIAKLSLWVKTAKRGKPLDSLDNNLKVGDSLIEDSNFAYLAHGFTWKSAFPEVFAGGGFDIVLGNPPYVRQELLGLMKPYLEKRFEVYHGVADLYCYFFERGLRLLKPGGRLGYISSSTFFKTGSGAPLRNYLRQNATIEKVVDFGDHQIFEGVTTYPAILTMRNETPTEDHNVTFWNVAEMPKNNFRASFREKAASYPQKNLSSGSWTLEDPALKALRDKIVAGKKTLKEVYGSPLYGIKTGRNEAFVIDRATRDRLIADDPKSAEVLKPWLEGKDLKRWRAESRDLSLIFFPKGWTHEHFGQGEEEGQWLKVSNVYPAICEHLLNYAEVCRKRGDKGDYWWELRACDYYKAFDQPKIIYKDIASSPSFFFDELGIYHANTGYFINTLEDHLTALMNSKLYWFVYLDLSTQIRGGFVRYFTQYVEKLPVPYFQKKLLPELSSLTQACQTAAENRYSLEQNLVRRIPDLCPAGKDAKLNTKLKNWWTLPDFAAFRAEVKKCFKADIPLSERTEWEEWITNDKAEIARLSTEIKNHEEQINKIVYELFELTPEEISLLEANI